MKLVIEIPNSLYANIKKIQHGSIASKRLLDCVKNGTPLDDVLDKIRVEIDKARFIDKDTMIVKNALASGLEVALQIIDKYMRGAENE